MYTSWGVVGEEGAVGIPMLLFLIESASDGVEIAADAEPATNAANAAARVYFSMMRPRSRCLPYNGW
jgi:hypothetical protein